MKAAGRLWALALAVPVILGLCGILAVRWGFGETEADLRTADARISAGFPPAVNVAGSSVAVSWSGGLDEGRTAGGYEIMRYDEAGNAYPAGGGCAGVVRGLSCVEGTLPEGLWQYSVRTRQNSRSVGLESARSLAVIVRPNGMPLLGWADSAYGRDNRETDAAVASAGGPKRSQ